MKKTKSKPRNNICGGELSRAPSALTCRFPPTLHLHLRWASRAREEREPLRSLERAGTERNDGDAAPAALLGRDLERDPSHCSSCISSWPDREKKLVPGPSARAHGRKR